MKKTVSGNEAIAYGALRAGVKVVSGYPGTPSTEVISSLEPTWNGVPTKRQRLKWQPVLHWQEAVRCVP